MKFGGTSVQDAAAIRRLCQLVGSAMPRRPVLVVSALAKVTDQLMNVGWAAAEGRLDAAKESLHLVRQRHEAVAGGLAGGEEYTRLCAEFSREFDGLNEIVQNIAREKAFTPYLQDGLLGVGESLSSKLVHVALRSAGIEAALVDARECIITDAAHTRATPLWDETHQRLRAVLLPLLQSGQTPVMGGFVGATQDVDPGDPPILHGKLKTPNYRVVLHTAEAETILQATVPRRETVVRIWVDDPSEPDQVIVGVG